MDSALFIKVAIAVAGALLWLYRKVNEAAAPAPGAMAAPPPLPRRARRGRPAAKPASAEEAEVRPPAAPHLDADSLRVTRPASARVRAEFRGVAALRRAVVAREVLGPPLCLRRPRV